MTTKPTERDLIEEADTFKIYLEGYNSAVQNPTLAQGANLLRRLVAEVKRRDGRLAQLQEELDYAVALAEKKASDEQQAIGRAEKDRCRLEVLMRHPDKLFIDGSGSECLYSGTNGGDGRETWHSDPRKAVDDIMRRVTTR